ncbi:unnamed protein product [Owenia fusiformis]|uniref:Uncharacterized protein n=1 Tax=Owenia fusiformis TaxID=6347 RepID=A0A8J1U0V9_OWEFU|nr:unnamed protein product [Owenia fusiformis]
MNEAMTGATVKSPRKISFSLDLPPIRAKHAGAMPSKTFLKAGPDNVNKPSKQHKFTRMNKVHAVKVSSIAKPANPFGVSGRAVMPKSGHRHTPNVTEDRQSKSAMARMTRMAKCEHDEGESIDVDEYIDLPCPWCQQAKNWHYRPLSYREESIIERARRNTASSRIQSAPWSTANRNLKRQNTRNFIKSFVFADNQGGKTIYAKPKPWLPHNIWTWGPGF